MVRIFVVWAFGVLFSVSTPVLAQQADPFMATPRLVETCKKALKAGDTAARAVCEAYLMGVFDATLAIQSETRRTTADPTFTVLCNPASRPDVGKLLERIVERAETEPDSLKVGPAIYVIRTLNVPFSCK